MTPSLSLALSAFIAACFLEIIKLILPSLSPALHTCVFASIVFGVAVFCSRRASHAVTRIGRSGWILVFILLNAFGIPRLVMASIPDMYWLIEVSASFPDIAIVNALLCLCRISVAAYAAYCVYGLATQHQNARRTALKLLAGQTLLILFENRYFYVPPEALRTFSINQAWPMYLLTVMQYCIVIAWFGYFIRAFRQRRD